MTVWHDGKLDQIKDWWENDGLSAGEIAMRVSDDKSVSRNAVIGLIHRKGWVRKSIVRLSRAQRAGHESKGGQQRNRGRRVGVGKTRKQYTYKQPKPKNWASPTFVVHKPRPEPKPNLPEPNGDANVALIDLTDSRCKWPIGDPRAADFRFCGHGVHKDGPYCEYHFHLARDPNQRPLRKVG